jgi:transcriptional regulator with GAF, ATPase, and Fis domain
LRANSFGYEKGAFTGATAQRREKFELAHGYTLFLDEVGDMSLATQAKLLRVLETHRVERLGSTSSFEVDVRILSATNKDLAAEITRQTFREDLYYRLRVVLLQLPPLREHKEDIPLLVGELLRMLAAKHRRASQQISRPAMDMLLAAEWKGNVRELKNMLESAIVMGQIDTIKPEDFPSDLLRKPAAGSGGTEVGLPALLSLNDYRQGGSNSKLPLSMPSYGSTGEISRARLPPSASTSKVCRKS